MSKVASSKFVDYRARLSSRSYDRARRFYVLTLGGLARSRNIVLSYAVYSSAGKLLFCVDFGKVGS